MTKEEYDFKELKLRNPEFAEKSKRDIKTYGETYLRNSNKAVVDKIIKEGKKEIKIDVEDEIRNTLKGRKTYYL